MFIVTEFDIGQFVYLKTDEEQLPRMIIGIQQTPEGIKYMLVCGTRETYHYGVEISRERSASGIPPDYLGSVDDDEP